MIGNTQNINLHCKKGVPKINSERSTRWICKKICKLNARKSGVQIFWPIHGLRWKLHCSMASLWWLPWCLSQKSRTLCSLGNFPTSHSWWHSRRLSRCRFFSNAASSPNLNSCDYYLLTYSTKKPNGIRKALMLFLETFKTGKKLYSQIIPLAIWRKFNSIQSLSGFC